MTLLPFPRTRCKPISSPVKYVGRKPNCRLFKSFSQGYEAFYSTELPVCSVAVSVSHSSFIILYHPVKIHLQPFLLTYQTFAILMLQFDLFLQSLELPLPLRLLILLMNNMHLLPLLSLLTQKTKEMLLLPLLKYKHFVFHHIRPVTELLQFLSPFYFSILWIVLWILEIHLT